ncbi:hypothetical protein PJ985_08475 [Streptomyces sp. ACA25]|uniref:hypothetical protein n=1 Tax=Streptomyces sp. ACA25 TaxID=3022596 RepID=UPI0023082D08|nr:hypothetical protein [Streptomyces sp. ACA25]MDB1087600.1 hypothetical protein [Streptomyces sp. ACA25]
MKVIKPSVLDEDTRVRFLSEVDSLRTVYGPFVAAFVGADADADQPWLAVEYVPGPDLRTLVTGHGPLPLAETGQPRCPAGGGSRHGARGGAAAP